MLKMKNTNNTEERHLTEEEQRSLNEEIEVSQYDETEEITKKETKEDKIFYLELAKEHYKLNENGEFTNF